MNQREVEARFWAKVDRGASCWIWTGARFKVEGSGRFYAGRKAFRAHRWAYELEHGPIPQRMAVRQVCGDRLCVKADHLELVPHNPNLPKSMAEHLAEHTDTSCRWTCWNWGGMRDPNGYGRVRNGRLAHREVYLEMVGPIPPATPHLDHLCRNTSCVNPEHLEPVTQRENNRRAAEARLAPFRESA